MHKRWFLAVLLIAPLMYSVPTFAINVWYVPGNFATIQQAIDSSDVQPGDRIMVGPGVFDGALVTKAVAIKGIGNATITSGPKHGSGMIQGFRIMPQGSGATIDNLRFTVDLGIMNHGLNPASNVTVTHSTFINSVQAISAWGANDWTISHNNIVDLRCNNGGGIGILVGDFLGRTIRGNVIEQNSISGTLHVASNDQGGYDGSGIVLYADFRWGAAGASEISGNRVVKNSIAVTSDTPSVVNVNAFEMTEGYYPTAPDPYPIVIRNNAVGFNDFRGTVRQILLTPPELDNPTNSISRNLGENRGKGLHPGIFR